MQDAVAKQPHTGALKGNVMSVLIAGASHVGKTLLAQSMLEKHGFPYFSIDHLKMGLIRFRLDLQ